MTHYIIVTTSTGQVGIKYPTQEAAQLAFFAAIKSWRQGMSMTVIEGNGGSLFAINFAQVESLVMDEAAE